MPLHAVSHLRYILSLMLLLPRPRALYQVVDVGIAGTTEQITILEAGMKFQDDDEMLAEITTWVPECKWYQKIPCTCSHAIFHTPEKKFMLGYDKLWHRPTLERLMTEQTKYLAGVRLQEHKYKASEPYFWHNGGMGGFKNSLDVSFYIVGAHCDQFPDACLADEKCDLSRRFSYVLNWLISLRSFGVFDKEKHLKQYEGFFEWLSQPVVVESWRTAPWHLLLLRPEWASMFIYVMDQLEGALAMDNAGPTPPNLDLLERFKTVLSRMSQPHDAGRCFESGGWWSGEIAPGAAVAAAYAQGGRRAAEMATVAEVRQALRTAFNQECTLPPIKRLVMFGQAIRPFLSEMPEHEVWPSTTAIASDVEGPSLYRLCGQSGTIVHRRCGQAELHFLAADIARVGGELLLELLWFASSDDRCIMAGTTETGAHGGKAYYSFLHTLPAAHLQHWRCELNPPGEGPHTPVGHAVSISFSGFASITTCRIPKEFEASLTGRAGTSKDNGRSGSVALELALTQDEGTQGWQPEALRMCRYPKPKRRKISACSAPLHNADRMHLIAPYLIEDWINYHLLIGIEHFTLFDTDGSYEPYVRSYVEKGLVTYYARWPTTLLPKVGLLADGVAPKERRPMLTEPQALDTCVWANRQVSDWVVVLHSFEEYLHSPRFSEDSPGIADAPLVALLEAWANEVPGGRSTVSIFELFQEPMGGPKQLRRSRSVISTWVHKRKSELAGKTGEALQHASEVHSRPFAWIVDPLNVVHTAVHLAQARADGQAVLAVPPDLMRVNHYIDLGSNKSRCLEELGGCEVEDKGMLWAEEAMLRMRRKGRRKPRR